MRILVTTGLYPPEIGGPATYSKFLVDQLPHLGFTVDVLPFRRVRRYWPVVRHVVFFFCVLFRGRRADVIYAQDTFSVGVPSAAANFFLRKKFLIRVPGDHVWEQGTRRFGAKGQLEEFPLYSNEWHPLLTAMRFLQQRAVHAADALVVPSKYMQKVVKKWEVPQKKIVLIYNGVEELADSGNKAVLRGMLKFQGKLIISVGRLVPWKGFRELISLMPKLKHDFPDLKLLIVGGGTLLKELESLADTLSLKDDIIFTGELERDVLLRYIRIADVFVLHSRYEGLSHQLLEVMTVGVPAVVSKVGGNPEVIDDGKNGYLVAIDDTKLLTSRISTLLHDTNLRAKIVAAAKRKVKQFSNERMLRETAQLLKRV